MHKRIKILIAAVAVLMLAILTVNLVMGATSTVNTSVSAANSLEMEETTGQEDANVITPEQAENEEQLRELAPKTAEEAERSIYPVKRRFLMWTNDGVHIMWGIYGNGRFVGTDNQGKRCWGIYGKGIFAGFYDGEFFWGRYNNSTWKAKYLFGLGYSSGSYVLFPTPAINEVSP